MPPEWMWVLSDELDAWFDEVQRRREEKYGGGDDDDAEDAPDMMQNELVKNRR